MTTKQLTLILSGAFMLIAFSIGIYAYSNKKDQALSQIAQDSTSVFVRPHSPTYGPDTAKVRIVEFFDPACETCRAFYPLVKQLVDAQQGKVQLVVRYIPLHQGSESAVRILEAARLQNLFWPVVQVVLNGQPMWASHSKPAPENIWGFVGNTGLDIAKARQDVNTPAVQSVIEQDMADANTLKVTRTPGFFVNGRPLQDFGYEQLAALVQEEVRKAYPQ